jgi:hypothetical protein
MITPASEPPVSLGGKAAPRFGHVRGYCPMGCGQTLFLGEGGHVTCSRLNCPNPVAVDDILGWPEHEHIVTFTAGDFTILHPLRERLNHDLVNCLLHARCRHLDGPPVAPGTYRARGSGDSWTWEAVSESAQDHPSDHPAAG